MRPAAVILDFDGVVADSLAAHLQAWAAAVAELWGGPLPAQETLAGHATRTIAHILAKRYGEPTLAGPLAAAKERLLIANVGAMQLLPGARDMVAALTERGLPFGIASNSRRAFVSAALAAAGLAVPVVLTGDDVSRPKPEPDIFWACANRLRVANADRERIAVFEDSNHGIRAARAAGMVPLGVASLAGAHVAGGLASAGAVAVCRSLADALERGWLEQLPSA